MRSTLASVRQSLQATSLKLIESEQRNSSLEAAQRAQKTLWESDKLELQTKINQLTEEKERKAPKVLPQIDRKSQLPMLKYK